MFKRLWKKHKAYIIALLIFTVIGASVAEQAVYKANEPKFVTYDKFEKDLDASKFDKYIIITRKNICVTHC